MEYFADLAMHQRWRANDFAAEYFADRLMPKTHAEDWSRLVKSSNDVFRQAGICRCAGSRRNHDARGFQPFDFFQSNPVIAINAQVLTQLSEVLNEVVGEGVVI